MRRLPRPKSAVTTNRPARLNRGRLKTERRCRSMKVGSTPRAAARPLRGPVPLRRASKRDDRHSGRRLQPAGDQGRPQGRGAGTEVARLHAPEGPGRQVGRDPLLLRSRRSRPPNPRAARHEQASASCPASSQIGTVDTSAGVGSEPIHVGGKVYLAGPYKGAPLSSVVVTPAVAGPFDLGDVVIRAPLYVNPETTRDHGEIGPDPDDPQGHPSEGAVGCHHSRPVQLHPQSDQLRTDEGHGFAAGFERRGGQSDQSLPGRRLQVAEVQAEAADQLERPDQTDRSAGAEGGRDLSEKGAYANIARAQVSLPHSEFLDQGNLDKVCTQPESCSKANARRRSIYGKAKAWSPLLDKPLRRARSTWAVGFGYKLPALVAELNGQIRVLLKGKVDSGQTGASATPSKRCPTRRSSIRARTEGRQELRPARKLGKHLPQTAAGDRPVYRSKRSGRPDKPLVQNECGKKKKGAGKGGKTQPNGKGKPKPKKG